MPERSPDNYPQAHTETHTDRLFVHDTALIAASAQLQTCAPYCIKIGAGVVIGEGCWFHACSGDIIIESGTVLGVGVLIVGWGKIGSLSLIGSAVTLFEVTIAPGTTIAAHSVQGLPEHDVSLAPAITDPTDEVDNWWIDPWDETPSNESSLKDNDPVISPHPPSVDQNPPPTSPHSLPPLQTSSFNPGLTSGSFIRSWKRPVATPDVHADLPPDNLEATPSEPIANRNPSDSDPPITDPVDKTSLPDAPIAHSSRIYPVTSDSSQTEDPPNDEPLQGEPTIEDRPEPPNLEPPTPRPQNVYGRQHVNRIIESILRRHNPDTST